MAARAVKARICHFFCLFHLVRKRKGQSMRTRVIVVTDGDQSAQEAVMIACQRLALYPLMASGGNPTPIPAGMLIQRIKAAPYDPVVVMLDDRGRRGPGKGEIILESIILEPELNVLGVVAVASDIKARGIEVDESVDCTGQVDHRPVNKAGLFEPSNNHYLEGDTVEVLGRYPEVTVIGSGDTGKMMNGADNPDWGADITTRCFERILKKSRQK